MGEKIFDSPVARIGVFTPIQTWAGCANHMAKSHTRFQIKLKVGYAILGLD
jgi:hypothetical protein